MGVGKPEVLSMTMLRPAEVAQTLLAGETPGAPPVAELDTNIVRKRGGQPRPEVAPEQRYVFVKALGQGGMGQVDEVFDASLGRTVAQKKVLHGAGVGPTTMLVAEAQTCAQLEHPSIVPVYDLGTDAEGDPAYTMRVVRGDTLRAVLLGPPEKRSFTGLLGVLRQVCLAVDYAHSRGVVHRDLKPENVIVGEFGEVYVLDWGVAHVIEGSDIRRTHLEGFIAGSPAYMAPEQATGLAIDRRTDVFALGVMLYELIAGQRPFDDSDVTSVRTRLHRDVEAAPSSRRPGAPTHFDALVLACLNHRPMARPDSARIIADAIDHYLDVERERTQRQQEADAAANDGGDALQTAIALEDQSTLLRDRAEATLAELPRWESVERKQPAWNELDEARRLSAEAARLLARAEASFTAALGRVAEHGRARAGLAALHHRQFVAADERGDAERRAQYLDLARRYDDGLLSIELSDEGELSVESDPPGAALELSRYEPSGLLLRTAKVRDLGPTPMECQARLASGSYLLVARHGALSARYPLLIRRAMRHHLRLRLRPDLGNGMVLVPGGPFLAPRSKGLLRFEPQTLGDFAISKFPVTMRDLAPWLDTLAEDERTRRCPSPFERTSDRAWRLREGPEDYAASARHRIGPGRELDIPALDVSWFTAVRYAEWMARQTALPLRLPTSLEWDKAARGADGRFFPMGNTLDPSFAKTRESRPEFSQPEPIGAFPLDESPYGVRDLAGGVGDWTSTMDDGNPPPTVDDEEDEVQRDRAVVWRGGYWSIAPQPKLLLRYSSFAKANAAWVGFRLAMSLPGPHSSLTTEPMQSAPLTLRAGT